MAFVGHAVSRVSVRRAGAVCMAAVEEDGRAASGSASGSAANVNRRAVLGGLIGVAAAVGVQGGVRDAQAGAGGAFSSTVFPKASFPDKLDMDKEALKDPKVQAGLKDLRKYRSALDKVLADFKADPQMDVAAKMRAEFSVSQLRNDLNSVNAVFDEETQKATDRVVRAIIQDIREIETAAVVKKGYERTPKKIEKTTGWITQMQNDFDKLLALY
ncbi:hypothetical protein FVE85_4066 [Porphyridium purpureum]|uniref:Uncharacterized protein n=1 Tax=Porphyridium purpureum TaxID=35688 RepID=A0A5J4YRI2_PORPP|nr:hypothetical protein FVE85_4066 [Porphyridium purpureum]|eukprot:POR1421..scf229_5